MHISSFIDLIFHGDKCAFREVDSRFDFEIMELLSFKTGVSIDRMREASILSDSGYVFDFTSLGTADWILPAATVGGGYSLTYCPMCLAEDPYYRRSWKFTFNPACPKHRILLRYNCPDCGKPYNYLNSVTQCIMVGASLIVSCCWCGADLKKTPSVSSTQALVDRILNIQNRLNSGINHDSFFIQDYWVHARPYLDVYLACMVSLADEAMAKWVLVNYAEEFPQDFDLSSIRKETVNKMPEYTHINRIATLMYLGDVLMQEWPSRFLHYAKKNFILPTDFFPSADNIPYWVTQTAEVFFLQVPRPPSLREQDNAKTLLRGELGRLESAEELRSFMTDGIVRDLYMSRKKSKRKDDIAAERS